MKPTLKYTGIFCLLLLCMANKIQGQSIVELLTEFESYAELPREITYLHLNKSVFLKGEPIGFKAYVLDKGSMELSEETANLYLTLTDQKGKTVKSDLFWVRNGTANGIIQLDSLFNPGEYTIKAFTNWMLNFQEFNHYEQSILVVDPDSELSEEQDAKPTDVFAHALPEGGHAPIGVESVFGLVFKDAKGYGLQEVTGRVVDQDKNEVTTFKVNTLGLGKFILNPKPGTRYQVEYQYKGRSYLIPIPNIEQAGVGLKLQDNRDEVLLRLSSSQNMNEEYSLVIHNGSKVTGVPIKFNNSKTVLLALVKKDLFPGINILTVFDQNQKPILERLYFNNYGWKEAKMDFVLQPVAEKDSLDLKIVLQDLDTSKKNSLSIAILPETTIASNSHHSLTSFAYLAPHLKTPIENAHYYFNDPSPKKWFELDLVMLTQGWSAYDWNNIFSKPPEELFEFQKGIGLVITDNNDSGKDYFFYPLTNHKSTILRNEVNRNSFRIDQLFPIQDEKMSLSQIEKKGGMVKPGVYLQFSPSEVPNVALRKKNLISDSWIRNASKSDLPALDITAYNNIRQLEEVVVTESKVDKRRERIRNVSAFGNVDFFEPDDPRRSQLLSTYLSTKGFVVNELNGQFEITARIPNSPNNPTPAILLDDVLLSNYSNLYQYRMDVVDYIVINKTGIGGGLRFGGGVIKIYTDPAKVLTVKATAEASKTSYTIPLTFTTPQQYYAPQFESYNSASFLRYGTLLWEPEVELNPEGEGLLRIPLSDVPEINLDIQGIFNGTPLSKKLNIRQMP